MKKIVVLLIAFIFLVGCGNNGENSNNDMNQNNDENQQNEMNVDVASNGNTMTVTTDNGNKTDVSIGDSVAIPANYPEEVLPVYPGSFVAAASENADGSFMIMAMTNDSYDQITSFYEEFLENSDKTMVSNSEENYLDMGNFMGYSYTVSIAESLDELGYKYSYTLILMKELDGMTFDEESDEADEASDESSMGDGSNISMGDEWPKDFPEDSFEVYDEQALEVRATMEMNGQQVIAFASEALYEDSIAYYEEMMESMDGYSSMVLDGSQMITGSRDGFDFMVIITKNSGDLGEPEKFDSLVQIFY